MNGYRLQVAVNGGFVGREFDAVEEAIEAIGHAIIEYEVEDESGNIRPDVVTLVLIPPDDEDAKLLRKFGPDTGN